MSIALVVGQSSVTTTLERFMIKRDAIPMRLCGHSETHWNDTIPYTNDRKAPKKHAIYLRLVLRRINPKKDGIAY
jgi:hypothetical protein